MNGNGRGWPEMTGNGPKWPEMAGNVRKWPEIAGNGRGWAIYVNAYLRHIGTSSMLHHDPLGCPYIPDVQWQ